MVNDTVAFQKWTSPEYLTKPVAEGGAGFSSRIVIPMQARRDGDPDFEENK
jgi:hypothetical protein